MKRLLAGSIAAVSLAALAQPAAAAIDIVFDYSRDANGFFASATRRDTLDAAAAVFEARLADMLTALPPPSPGNTYSLGADNPSGGVGIVLVNQPILPNEIRVFVGGRTGLGSLGQASTQLSVSATSTAFFEMVIARGQTGALASPATDYGPWGGSIAFLSDALWHDSHATPVASDRFDLYSIALHEIGHLLGVGQSNSWDDQRSGLVFNGAAAVAAHGSPVPLADDGHWASDVLSPINGAGAFETAMDPVIANGVRKPFTDLDWAALQDIGWQVTPIPEPQTWATMLAGLVLVAGALARRRFA